MSENTPQEIKINDLLEQLSTSRSELSKYMTHIDTIRQKVDLIFPSNHDFRNKFVLEEKIKAMSSFYSTLLSIRQEFNKTIKEEIEIRRKMNDPNSGESSVEDIRAIAGLVEEHQKQEKTQEKLIIQKDKDKSAA